MRGLYAPHLRTARSCRRIYHLRLPDCVRIGEVAEFAVGVPGRRGSRERKCHKIGLLDDPGFLDIRLVAKGRGVGALKGHFSANCSCAKSVCEELINKRT